MHPEITMTCSPMVLVLDAWERGDNAALRAFFRTDAEKLAAAGADFFVCPDNTAHIALESPGEPFPIPGLHIGEVVAERALRDGRRKVGILGTKYTMGGPVYPGALGRRGLDWVVPAEADRALVNAIIFDELCLGVFTDQSRDAYVRIIEKLADEGCDSVALVCTEIPLLITQDASPLPILDFDPPARGRRGRSRDRRPAAARVARRARRLGGSGFLLEPADVAAEPLVEEVDDRPHARRVADPLVGEQPQLPAVIAARREALDQIGIGVGDDARQHGDPEARADARQESARGRMMHRDLLFQSKRLEPVLIVDPEVAAAAADERMLLQLRSVPGDAVAGGIVAAAVERPIVDAELAPDQAGRQLGCPAWCFLTKCRLRPRRGRGQSATYRGRSRSPGRLHGAHAAEAREW